jgi:hypothetical protein
VVDSISEVIAMSKVLVVVYSYTGTSRRLAQMLAAWQEWPIGEIRDATARKGMWRCIVDSMFSRRPAIVYDDPDPGAFDAVVLISPIWAYRLAGPMRSFVASRRKQLRDVAVLSVMGSRGAPNAVAEVTRLIGRTPIMDAAFTSREVEDSSFAGRMEAFGNAVQQAEEHLEVVMRPAVWSPQAG